MSSKKNRRDLTSFPCYLQKEPAHKLTNLKDIPVLDVSAEASYHRIFDSCIPSG